MPLNPVQTEYHIGQDEDTLRLFELRKSTACCGYLLPTLHKLPPTFKLLDVGCGPASITFELANIFPQAKIIGLDQDLSVTERNEANIKNKAPGTGIEFRVGNILQPDDFLAVDEIGSFDVVHEHACLIHIPDNIEAIKQMRRISKTKGGLIASRNGDLRSQILFPPCVEYEKFIHALYASNKSDIETGRKIISKAIQAGFRRDQIQASASVLTIIAQKDREVWAESMFTNLADENSEMSKSAKALGYNVDALELVKENMRRFAAAEDGWRLLICSEIICQNDS